MSTRTRLKAAVQVPQRRRTVTRRPLNQPDTETPDTEMPDTETPVPDDQAADIDDQAPDVDGETSTENALDEAKTRKDAKKAKAGKDEKPAEAGKSGRRRRPSIAVICLGVALAAAVVAAGVTGYQWYSQRSVDQAHQEAMAAARQTTVNFVSVSAATVDRDLKRVTDGATGEFKDEFTKGAPQVRAAVVENNVDSRGTVLRTGLVSGDEDSAVVLVAVDATVKNVNAPQGRSSHYRIQVEMSKDAESGRWLVSKLQFVG